jgi:HEPN domain-containing protein
VAEKDLIEYWRKSAERDLEVAEGNFRLGHYHWSLFFFQLVLEKILKSLVVKNKKESALPTHDLVKLASEAGVELTTEQKQDFKEITSYNIEARYDDIKLSFYKKATRQYAQKWTQKCKEYYLWLKGI